MASITGMRDETGKLISYTFPGGYPVFYLDDNDNCLCPDCANEEDTEVVAGDVNYEDENLYCDDCNEKIQSAYGEDE